MNYTTERRAEAGFTLVELSIVLVIIGLIVGGVLAGQDMIKAAEVRATVAQVEKYNTAVNTFRDKFGVMPGDAGESKATQFGMPVKLADGTARSAATINADQDGLLECNAAATCGSGAATATDKMAFGSETSLFWSDLSWAVLISESLQTTDGTVGGGAGGAITPGGVAGQEMGEYMPLAKIGRGNYFTVFSAAGKNFYQLAGLTSVANATGIYALENRLTPQEAFNLDQKADDGRPHTGGVRALDAGATAAAGPPTVFGSAVLLNNGSANMSVPSEADVAASGRCVNDSGTNAAQADLDDDIYQTTTDDDKNTPSCMLRFIFN